MRMRKRGLLLFVWNLLGMVVAEPQVPCFFIFGDSLSDSGNDNNLVTSARANYPPYGIDFPGGPTGRFCNGRTAVDFIGFMVTNTGCCRVDRSIGEEKSLPFGIPCQNRSQHIFWDDVCKCLKITGLVRRGSGSRFDYLGMISLLKRKAKAKGQSHWLYAAEGTPMPELVLSLN